MSTSPDVRRVQRVGAWLRRMPSEFPGKMRAARLLLGQALNARDVELQDRDGNRFLFPHLSEPMALHLIANGVYEAETQSAILEQLSADAFLIDVGANIGLVTVPAGRKTVKGGVIALEASRQMFGYLEENVARNQLENVRLMHTAVSDRTEDAQRFYDAPLEKFGMGSLAPQFAGEYTVVPTQSLDDLLTPEEASRARVLKIDVEGFEAAVLAGATHLLTRAHPPVVVFEFIDWAEERAGERGAAQRVLRALGFDIWRLEDWQRHKAPLESVVTEGAAMLVAQKR